MSNTDNTYESQTFSLDCGNVTDTQRFYMDTQTGEITFSGDYDLDVAGTPDQLDCTVTVTDYYGLSDTVALYVHIQNKNEFTPQFTHSSYTFFLPSNTLIGTYLGSVSAVDLDSSDDDDNKITYSIDQTNFANDILAVNNDGSVYLISSLVPLQGNSNQYAYILATNEPGSSTTGTTTVFIEVPATTTVTTTTTDKNLGNPLLIHPCFCFVRWIRIGNILQVVIIYGKKVNKLS